MEKAIVLYERAKNGKRAYVQTLAKEEVLVCLTFIDEKYYEIMVFKADNHGRIIDYSDYENYRILDHAAAEELFEIVIENWRSETRTLDEIDPEHAMCL